MLTLLQKRLLLSILELMLILREDLRSRNQVPPIPRHLGIKHMTHEQITWRELNRAISAAQRAYRRSMTNGNV
jgi:hypothetical protein